MESSSNTNSQKSENMDLELDRLLRELAGIELFLRHEYQSPVRDEGIIRELNKKKRQKLEQCRKVIYGFEF